MTITMSIYELSMLLIAIGFIVIIIVLIPTVLQAKKTLKSVEELSVESRKAMERLNVILEKAGANTADVEELVKRFKDVALGFMGLAEMVLEHVRSPILTILSLILGAEFGLKRLFGNKDKTGGEGHDKQ
ncbi:MAG: hypothetical protein HY886_08865 [Deltaproteobacteria bacterium]|nr:hypothetical protein [Deltaproteobacteria bacterium]